MASSVDIRFSCQVLRCDTCKVLGILNVSYCVSICHFMHIRVIFRGTRNTMSEESLGSHDDARQRKWCLQLRLKFIYTNMRSIFSDQWMWCMM